MQLQLLELYINNDKYQGQLLVSVDSRPEAVLMFYCLYHNT